MSRDNNLAISTCANQGGTFELLSGDSPDHLTGTEILVNGSKKLRRCDDESMCAVLAADEAYRRLIAEDCHQGISRTSETRMVLWQTLNAGFENYLRVLGDAWSQGPTPQSVVYGPISSYNAPGSLVSIELNIRGPQLFTVGASHDLAFLTQQLDLLFDEYTDINLAVIGVSSTETESTSSTATAIALPRSSWILRDQRSDLISTLIQQTEDFWRAKCR